MRILHLAYEDPRQPGSGGGSVRTQQINQRLAERHDITVVVSSYPGAVPRRENGVYWLPIGRPWGYTLSKLSYFGLMWTKVLNSDYDLIVEDFGAPFSTGFAPLFTRTPVVASVQWLFAAEMTAKYHLPVHHIEQFGLRFYNNFIAVSSWLAEEVKRRCAQEVCVEVIPNGVEQRAFTVEPHLPQHLVYVGRLDIPQKGCDLLINAYAKAKLILQGKIPPLMIVGDGPDKKAVEDLIRQRELTNDVTLCGRISGDAKYQMMADSYAVLMPSRFETFGMVAVEAQAAYAPVITFDVGPLREVTGGGGARIIPAFDIDLFAEAVVECVQLPDKLRLVRQQGHQWAQRYDWDTIALQQEAHYLRAVNRS